ISCKCKFFLNPIILTFLMDSPFCSTQCTFGLVPDQNPLPLKTLPPGPTSTFSSQSNVIASKVAMVFLPVPGAPCNKYACDTRFLWKLFIIILAASGCVSAMLSHEHINDTLFLLSIYIN